MVIRNPAVAGCALVVALLAMAWSLAAATPAHATFYNFCGSSSNMTYLGFYPNDRCAHSAPHFHYYTRTYVNAYTPHCAIVKQYPTGGGANHTAPACGLSSSYMESDCTVPYSCDGYATITNDDTPTSYGYWGFASI